MWSSGFVGARLGTAEAPADTLLAWRYLAASAVLVLVVAAGRGSRGWPRRGELGRHALLGHLCARSDRLVPLSEVDTRLVGMVLSRNGELVDTGAGAAALGDPVGVVAWLANTLGERGVALEPGHLIMTGALHAAVPMAAGEEYLAEFDRLGPVTVRVVA